MRRGTAAVAALAGALLLSACDGPAQYATPAIFVLLQDDGTAEINWQLSADDPEVETVSALVIALSLPAPTRGDDGLYRVTGLQSPVHLDLAAVQRASHELGLDSSGVFVSVCIPHSEGEVDGSGNGVELTHWDSCATYHSGDVRIEEGGTATATVEFGSRLHPAWWYLLAILGLAAVGPTALVVGHRRGWTTAGRRTWQVLSPLAVIVASFTSIGAGGRVEPYWATGIQFDEGFGDFFRTVGLIGLGIAFFGLPILYYALGPKKRPERSDGPR